jgi:hypothetical protein
MSTEPVQVPAPRENAVAAMVIGSVTVAVLAVGLCESVTLNVTLVGPPAVVGVPVINPPELRINPAGRWQVEGQLHV